MPKVDEIDFKTGESVAPEVGQPETTETKEEAPEADEASVEAPEETTEVPVEDVETLKERLTKLEEEKENYKKGMLKYKDLSLKKTEDKTEEKEEEYPDWDETSKKFQKQTLTQAEKAAEKRALEIVGKYNEKAAIAQFTEKHPEVAERWDEIVANYNPKNGKESVQDIVKDLNRAYILTRYDKGEIDSLEADALKKGERKGKAEAQIADMSSVSKTTSKTTKGSDALSPGALKLAEKMRVDPKKLAQEDDSSTAEIKL